jgi:hypothetical protein
LLRERCISAELVKFPTTAVYSIVDRGLSGRLSDRCRVPRAESGCDRAAGEDPVPFGRNLTGPDVATALNECESYALQGFEGRLVQALAGYDDESPAVSLKGFSPFDVIQPIGTDFGMVAAVVLDDEL